MIVYIRIDILNGCNVYTAYNQVNLSPSYIWRYSNYSEGLNYLRTYTHKSFIRYKSDSYSLAIL